MLIRARVHPFPSRTRKLSSLLLTILGWRRPGKIGSANTEPRDESRGVLSCPEKVSSGCLRHHTVTGQLSSLLLTILGWRRPGKIGSANTKPRDESRGVIKRLYSKIDENLVFSRGGVTSVTPFPLSAIHSEG